MIEAVTSFVRILSLAGSGFFTSSVLFDNMGDYGGHVVVGIALFLCLIGLIATQEIIPTQERN